MHDAPMCALVVEAVVSTACRVLGGWHSRPYNARVRHVLRSKQRHLARLYQAMKRFKRFFASGLFFRALHIPYLDFPSVSDAFRFSHLERLAGSRQLCCGS